MEKTRIRIITNSELETISYQIKNEKDEWVLLSGDSKLSRQEFSNTTISKFGNEILKCLDSIYNRKKNGIEIFFVGTTKEFSELRRLIENNNYKNVKCTKSCSKIAVMGRFGVGKTTLIKSIEEMNNKKYSIEEKNDIHVYKDDNSEWFEIDGLDCENESSEKCEKIISDLIDNNLDILLYCLDSNRGRLEQKEKKFILKNINDNPKLQLAIVLTQCWGTDCQSYIDILKREMQQVLIIPTIAKKKTALINKKEVCLNVSGMDTLSKFIFEGR